MNENQPSEKSRTIQGSKDVSNIFSRIEVTVPAGFMVLPYHKDASIPTGLFKNVRPHTDGDVFQKW